ncbi:hypothetical protein SAMD00079811_69380 [Scytonema sp. HK-05]|uniref:VMAP-C domain-containing protein n=1 Tax=Scytonema sp. HK-05 TaxID=1137095 RepID=UPI000937B8BE|nr:effector-associated domain EAD1-containing protein [Scytonema sp. HK-05]OKH58436.1 hypothetical protein NIES2130_14205 [Scytonema sp. HK-05]BAY49309.1 hypothetical protein SAMD00079811_69380 [Scytonema sp. HK-05]
MGLTNFQRKTLREALILAYPNKEDLQLMLEDELDWQPSAIPEGKTYELTVSNIIKIAEQKGDIRKFVIGASKRNPRNPKLRECVTELLSVLFDDVDNDLLEPKSLTSLINIIKDFQDFEIIKDCCDQIIPDISDHRSQELKDMENQELAHAVKWLIVLGLLLKDYPQKPDGIPYIIKFMDCLQYTLKQQSINYKNNDLSNWLQEVKQYHNYQTPSHPHTIQKQIVALRGYLVIVVRIANNALQTENQSSPLQVDRFISIETVQLDDSTQCQMIPLHGLEPGQYYDLKSVEENLNEWVHQAETKLGNEVRKIDCSSNLTIEFFLPWEHLAEAVDEWQVSLMPRSNNRVPIGKKHQVVLRSLDRLDDYYSFSQLDNQWKKTEKFMNSNPTKAEIQEKIEHLNCLIECDWEVLAQRLEYEKQLALKLTCVMPTCKTSDNSTTLTNLFQSILKAGTPIVLWSRQCNLPDVSSKMDLLLVSETLLNESQLLEEVKEIRKKATTTNKQHCGHHLAILYDEPQRLRQMWRFLHENQLWGMSA